MNNSLVLSLAVGAIPTLAMGYVCVMLLYKLYITIRSNFNSSVNCWFCNHNTTVPYVESNSWTCPHCEQYNGFTKDGDYNREMFEQLDCSTIHYIGEHKLNYSDQSLNTSQSHNGFCDSCNEAQRLKVEKLAQFEPKRESNYDVEIIDYKAHLEERYRLCATCDRKLNKVLREKKKMVLGSKFLSIITKGAEKLQEPHFKKLRHVQLLIWKQRLTLLISLLALVNMCCLINALPPITRSVFTSYLGEKLGELLFIGCSHLLALSRVCFSYLEHLNQQDIIIKLRKFARTIFLLVLYSMGYGLPQAMRITFSSLYTFVAPFVILSLAFGYNVMDGFRFTRFTLLLVLWSALTGGFVTGYLQLTESVLMILASLATLVLSFTNRLESSNNLYDSSGNSFHKIYSEDYLSDDDTMSTLSQQMDSSTASVRSHNTSHRLQKRAPFSQQLKHLNKSPITSSTFSLNQLPAANRQSQLSPNSSFRSFCCNGDHTQALNNSYAGSMYNFPTSTVTPARSILHASHSDLANHAYPHSPMLGLRANTTIGNGFLANSLFGASHGQHLNKSDDERYLLTPAGNRMPYALQSAFPATVETSHSTRMLHTPLSASSNAVYSQSQRGSLLTPSRFRTNSLYGNGSGIAQSLQQPFSFSHRHDNIQFERHNKATVSAIDDNLSRSSSQSSGFESQNGPYANFSRENSLVTDNIDLLQRPKSIHDSAGRAFLPVKQSPAYLFSPQPSLMRPLSVKCSSVASDLWSAPQLRRSLHSRDVFNLRKINDELPTIKRGDLLKKWKKSQGIS